MDLDDDNPTIMGPILQYPFSVLGDTKTSMMTGFHVRGSSIKEKINLNEITICYMLHGENLWMWADN